MQTDRQTDRQQCSPALQHFRANSESMRESEGREKVTSMSVELTCELALVGGFGSFGSEF